MAITRAAEVDEDWSAIRNTEQSNEHAPKGAWGNEIGHSMALSSVSRNSHEI